MRWFPLKDSLFNLFQSLWPELFRMEGFNKSMLTPIVKATKGKKVHSFYGLSDYENGVRQIKVGILNTTRGERAHQMKQRNILEI